MPKVQLGDAPALSAYHFKQDDEQATIVTAINKLAYGTKNYPGFEAFKEEVLKIVGFFGRNFHIQKLTRTGLRYINAIPCVLKDGILPLGDYLDIGFTIPPPATDKFSSMSFVFFSMVGSGTLRTRIEHVIAEDKSHEAILLDFDYSMESDLTFDKIETYLDESHSVTKGMFESMITDKYRNYIRGEGI